MPAGAIRLGDGMKIPHWPAAISAVVFFGSTGLQTVSAQLPSLNEKPWLGYFAVYENRNFQFTVTGMGKVDLTPKNEKGLPMARTAAISIVLGIEEIQPDGTFRLKAIQPGTLESADLPTDKFKKTVIRGKVAGDAAFEATLEQDGGQILIGGRITDPGTLKKHPLRFVVRTKIPNMYAKDKKEEKKDLKAFEKKIKSDNVDLKWTDGERHKVTFEESVDVTTKEVNGPGIASAAVEITAYKDTKFLFTASENSSIALWNAKPAPLHQGFFLIWSPDAAKDPEGKARFGIQVK